MHDGCSIQFVHDCINKKFRALISRPPCHMLLFSKAHGFPICRRHRPSQHSYRNKHSRTLRLEPTVRILAPLSRLRPECIRQQKEQTDLLRSMPVTWLASIWVTHSSNHSFPRISGKCQ